jgi:hypothetical protein
MAMKPEHRKAGDKRATNGRVSGKNNRKIKI